MLKAVAMPIRGLRSYSNHLGLFTVEKGRNKTSYCHCGFESQRNGETEKEG
jgi:hypothetical protein